MSDLFASSAAAATSFASPFASDLASDLPAGPAPELAAQLRSALARYSTAQRLFHLQGEGPLQELLVEAWSACEALSELPLTRILCLSSNAGLSLESLLGRPVRLQLALADGTRSTRSGLVASARSLGANGGFARFELVVLPWLWWATQRNTNRIFADKTLLEIVTEVLAPYATIGTWHATPEVDAFLSTGRTFSRYAQYNTSDFDFLARLLAEEGLGFCFVEDPEAPCGHSLRLFSDVNGLPEDYSAQHQNGGAGIRFHRGHSQEEQDAIQALGHRRRLDATVLSALSWDYKQHRAVAASVPTAHAFGGEHAPVLEAYDYAGLYAWSSAAQAQRYLTLAMEAREARYKHFFGRSTVRTFQVGTTWTLTQSTFDDPRYAALHDGEDDEDAQPHGSSPEGAGAHAASRRLSAAERRRFVLLSVLHAGLNNLPSEAQAAIAQLLGECPVCLPFPSAFSTASADTGSGAGVARANHSSGTLRRNTRHPDLAWTHFAANSASDDFFGDASGDDPGADPWTPSWPAQDGWAEAGANDALPASPFHDPWGLAIGPQLRAVSARNHPHPLHEEFAAVLAQAHATGYGNAFTAQRAAVPWRPVLEDETGLYHRPRPTAPGPQTALVVGPNGETTPQGADELYTDRLGRVCLRPHWSQGSNGSPAGAFLWARVGQLQGGAGMGAQWIPRIGTEVLVDYLEGDINRPVVIACLYNGRGEGGVVPTPGGQMAGQSAQPSPTHSTDASELYAQAKDHVPSAQGNLAGGYSPPWHGASGSEAGHRNAAALSGVKTKEFGGAGYNQLVFDDTDAQLRIQLATTQAHTQLNLGHLIHQADNYRGSFRGEGWEARTDAYLAVRGGRGVMVSSYGLGGMNDPGAWRSETPAGDFTAGQALLQQLKHLGDAFGGMAGTHQSVKLAAQAGSRAPNQSLIDRATAPLAALEKVARGMVSATQFEAAREDAAEKNTAAQSSSTPHFTDPIVAFAGRSGLIQVAGQDHHTASGETHTQASGGHTVHHTLGSHKLHTGQAIGMLAGATQPGEHGIGLQLLAAKDPLQLQAQSDEVKLLAQQAVKLASAQGDVTLAAPKEILLRNSAGSYIKIAGGNIEVRCPGTLTVHAGSKVLGGGGKVSYELIQFPQSDLNIRYTKRVRFSS